MKEKERLPIDSYGFFWGDSENDLVSSVPTKGRSTKDLPTMRISIGLVLQSLQRKLTEIVK